ncbi:MAG: GntR family transcriptional regulator [Alphaproteobacteria bacterium]|nr:GntR family transcriptional regulator [Alphaproteobacteria bacterium]
MTVNLTGLEPIVDETRRGQIARKLRELIVYGNVSPGERLTETDLARRLGVSRAPLREAIRELVESGLVESIPYKGLFVRRVTRTDLEELYSLRTALEQFAFQQCWNRRSDEALEDLFQRHRNLIAEVERNSDPQQAIELELVLHSWCYELSGHSLLLKAWDQMKPNLQFYFTLHQKAHNRPGPLREAHDVYVKFASGDDLNAMISHLEQHMRQGLETTMKDIALD